MISTRHCSLILISFVLVCAFVFGVGYYSGSSAESDEPSIVDGRERWRQVEDNIKDRMQEFLENDLIMQDYGISPYSWGWLEENFERIKLEEMRKCYDELYPGYEFDAEWRAITLSQKYASNGEGTIRDTQFESMEVYQEDWARAVAHFRVVQMRDQTELFYELSPYFGLRFADGEKVIDYLYASDKAEKDENCESIMNALVDFFENCIVGENGYLVYRADGFERTILAWYGTSLKAYMEDDFQESDVDSLPNYYDPSRVLPDDFEE